MFEDSESNFSKYIAISRKVFYSSIVLFVAAGLFSLSGVTWLVLISIWLSKLSSILLFFSWSTPGFLVFIGVPWIARAWLRGINSIYYSDRQPWKSLPQRERFSVYFQSIFLFSFVVLAIIMFTARYLYDH